MSTESVVVLADRNNICAVRGWSAYVAVAYGVGRGLGSGHLLLVVAFDGSRGLSPVAPSRMMAALQSHLRGADLPVYCTMHSFRVGGYLTESLAGSTVDENMKLGG